MEKPGLDLLIALVDCSWSMSKSFNGKTRQGWAVALADAGIVELTRFFAISKMTVVAFDQSVGEHWDSDTVHYLTGFGNLYTSKTRGTALWTTLHNEILRLTTIRDQENQQGRPFSAVLMVLTDGEDNRSGKSPDYGAFKALFSDCSKGNYIKAIWTSVGPSTDATNAQAMGAFFGGNFGSDEEENRRKMAASIRRYIVEPSQLHGHAVSRAGMLCVSEDSPTKDKSRVSGLLKPIEEERRDIEKLEKEPLLPVQ